MIKITAEPLKIKEIIHLHAREKISIDKETRSKIKACRKFLDEKIHTTNRKYYGINTGFGSLHDIQIDLSAINELQENLVKSHACGTGSRIAPEIVKWMLLLKIKNISLGHSAASTAVVDLLVKMYNENILPVVYEQGSLGASGDLAPLAHMSLPLLGLGEVYYEDRIVPSYELREILGPPIALRAKEGLALLNGTQFMSAHGLYTIDKLDQLKKASEYIAALSLDAFDCSLEPFDHKIHKLRNQKGQIHVARRIKTLLRGSQIAKQAKKQTQDPYSFRCIPQVHGASYDVFDRVADVIEKEINAVTDNPLIFPEEDQILSGGNFHGQTLALHLDFLAMAIAEMASISERRTYQLISGQRELPDFLVDSPGLQSGLMIAQYTAASIVSQNKQLCSPASVDSIVSSNGQEDHVSMGANAATKLIKVLENTYTVMAIELINASQAMYYREKNTSPELTQFLKDFRKSVPLVTHDRILHYDIISATRFIKKYSFEI